MDDYIKEILEKIQNKCVISKKSKLIFTLFSIIFYLSKITDLI